MFKLKSFSSIKALALVNCLNFVVNNSVFNLSMGSLYYGVIILSLSILFLNLKKPILNWNIVLFIIACLISIFVNEIPYFYRPIERLIGFIAILALFGPLLQSYNIGIFKKNLFEYVNTSIVILVFLSFLGLVVKSPIVFMGRGGYTGFFNHSMFLSPMAAISMLTCTYRGIKSSTKKLRIMFYSMAFVSFIVCMTAGSRAALLAGLLSIMYFLYQIRKRKLGQFAQTLFLIISIAILSFPLWETYTEKIIYKMEYSEREGGLLTTREELWNRRINEFISSPIFGIGFSNDSSKTENDSVIGDGQIEPGSSWLVIFSMTGVLGFILFIRFLVKNLKLIKRQKNDKYSVFLQSLILFFMVHMFAEGYILSAGSGLFFYFWLLQGVKLENKLHYKGIIKI